MMGDNHDPFALARVVEPVRDPILDLIADEDRLRSIGIGHRCRADEAIYALSKEERRRLHEQYPDEEDLPEPFGPLYAEAVRYEEEAGEIHDRIAATKPITLDGAIALLEFAEPDEPLIITAIEGLREIAAKGGAA
jgi:hypothetical protein